MPSTRSTFLKALAFLGFAWSAQVAIAALPTVPDAAAPLLIPAVVVVAADPLAAAPVPSPSATNLPVAPPVATIAPVPGPAIATAPDPRQIECIAKVILHEAGSRAGPGQVAVAQVIRARVRSGRFASDACGVVRQRGQFFDVDGYSPPRNVAWTRAVGVATDVLGGGGEDVAPGALFFHSAAAARNLGAHVVVAQIGGNVFYR